MKGLVLVLVLLPAVMTWASPVVSQASPDEVRDAMRAVPAARELKEAILPLLDVAMDAGRVTPGVAVLFLREMGRLGRSEAEAMLTLLLQGLRGQVPLNKWMNEGLKPWRMPRPPSWQDVLEQLELRMRLLLATRSALAGAGLQEAVRNDCAFGEVLAEVAWAVGDFLVSEGRDPADSGALEQFVRGRLLRLRGTLVAAALDPLLDALSPEMVAGIVAEAFAPQRR